MIRLIVFLSGVFLFSQTASAQVYRCEDDVGKVTYSGIPCGSSGTVIEEEMDSNISVIDSSGARALAPQQSIRGSSQAIRGGGGEAGQYAHQIRAMLHDARQASEHAARLNDRSARSRQAELATHLMKSASILESATRASSSGVSSLRESNNIAEDVARLTIAPSRSSMVREAKMLQRKAAIELGSSTGVASPQPSEPGSPRNPASPAGSSPSSMPAPPSQPSMITSCDAGGCWDNLGNRYNRGAGGTHFPATGGSCQLIGGMMRCP